MSVANAKPSRAGVNVLFAYEAIAVPLFITIAENSGNSPLVGLSYMANPPLRVYDEVVYFTWK